MKQWVFSWYDSLEIRPSLCHPDYADERDEYILEKYGAKCVKREEKSELWVDLGGMISTKEDESIGDVDLGDGRTISCWKHQVTYVYAGLEHSRTAASKDGKTYYKFASWPGFMCIVSEEDLAIIKEALLEARNPQAEVEHQEMMREVLINANVAAHGEEKRDDINRIFRKGEAN